MLRVDQYDCIRAAAHRVCGKTIKQIIRETGYAKPEPPTQCPGRPQKALKP